jgi:hypothetical protein
MALLPQVSCLALCEHLRGYAMTSWVQEGPGLLRHVVVQLMLPGFPGVAGNEIRAPDAFSLLPLYYALGFRGGPFCFLVVEPFTSPYVWAA